MTGPAIVCAQAGNVNTGACDPLLPIVASPREAGAWVHVDGAFGLWAAASPRLASLVAGADGADSWALDAHKWLNVPYDCGLAIVADAEAHASRDVATAPSTCWPSDERDSDQDARDVPPRPPGSRSTPRCATSVAPGSPSSSSAAAPTRPAGGSVEGVTAPRSLNDVVLNQVLRASTAGRAHARAIEGSSAAASVAGRDRLARHAPRRASRSRTGRPRTRTSTASRRRCRTRSPPRAPVRPFASVAAQ